MCTILRNYILYTMPEGPEVRSIVDVLNQKITGKTLVQINWNHKSRFHKKSPTNYYELKKLFPLTVIKVTCKGKQIFFHLECKSGKIVYLNSFLGMSGSWLFNPGKYSDMWFNFGNVVQSKPIDLCIVEDTVYYNDQRHFGSINIYLTLEEYKNRLNDIGPDLLNSVVTSDIWNSLISKHRRCSIISFLMNQGIVSGVGNYLSSEIMYRSRIKPDRKISELNQEEIDILLKVSIQTIQKSYASKGLTIKDYQDPNGDLGTFELQVYQKDVDPYGNSVMKNKFYSGRTTHWVPGLQV